MHENNVYKTIYTKECTQNYIYKTLYAKQCIQNMYTNQV